MAKASPVVAPVMLPKPLPWAAVIVTVWRWLPVRASVSTLVSVMPLMSIFGEATSV